MKTFKNNQKPLRECSECDDKPEILVKIKYDHFPQGTITTYLCKNCLSKALKAVQRHEKDLKKEKVT